MKRLLLLFALLAGGWPAIVSAKHVKPATVPPAFTSTLRIEAPLDDGKVARIRAFDRADGHLLWSLVVFKNRIYPWREECVQWRFITSLLVAGDTVEITAEDGRRYRVMLATRKVERLATPKKAMEQPSKATAASGRGSAAT